MPPPMADVSAVGPKPTILSRPGDGQGFGMRIETPPNPTDSEPIFKRTTIAPDPDRGGILDLRA